MVQAEQDDLALGTVVKGVYLQHEVSLHDFRHAHQGIHLYGFIKLIHSLISEVITHSFDTQ